MMDEQRQAWWQDAGRGFFPWQNPVRGRQGGFFLMWAWMAVTAYVWNAGFQQFAATRQGFRADWSTAGFTLPVLILLVLASIALMFGSRTARKVLAALSLFLVHVFVCSLITRAAWDLLGLAPKVVTLESMLVEIAVAAAGALPVVLSTMPLPLGMPLTTAIVVLPLRNAPVGWLNVCLPLAAFLLWAFLACESLYLL